MKGKILFVGLFLVAIFIWGKQKAVIAQTVEFDPSSKPYDVYCKFGADPVFNKVDNTITWVSRASTSGAGSKTGIRKFASRYYMYGTNMYVDICTGLDDNGNQISKYGRYTNQIKGSYRYDMTQIKLEDIVSMFSKAYPSRDFSQLFSGSFVIKVDSLMGIRKGGVYYCETDFAEDGYGRLYSEGAKRKGVSVYHDLYVTKDGIVDAYKKITGISLKISDYYDKYITIEPNGDIENGEEDVWTIETGGIVLSGGNNYRYDSDKYYVKADLEYQLSWSSRTYLNGELHANATYQPTKNGLFCYVCVRCGGTDYMFGCSRYMVTAKGGGVSGFTTSLSAYQNKEPHIYVGATQRRSNDLTTLETSVTLKMEKDFYTTYYGQAYLVVDDENIDMAQTKGIMITADGTAPAIDISEKNQITGVYKITASDNQSGVKKIRILDESGSELLTETSEDSFEYVIPKKYTTIIIESTDNVGNTSKTIFTIPKPEFKPPKVVGTH